MIDFDALAVNTCVLPDAAGLEKRASSLEVVVTLTSELTRLDRIMQKHSVKTLWNP